MANGLRRPDYRLPVLEAPGPHGGFIGIQGDGAVISPNEKACPMVSSGAYPLCAQEGNGAVNGTSTWAAMLSPQVTRTVKAPPSDGTRIAQL